MAVLDWLQEMLGGGNPAMPQSPDALQRPQAAGGADSITPSFDRPAVPDTGVGTYGYNANQAAGEIGTAMAGLAERFNKGALNTLGFRQPGGDIYRGEIPVGPGLQRAGDVATFLSGGLNNSLFPAAGAFRQAAGAFRQAAPAFHGLLADEAGALRLTPAQRQRQQITLDTPLASVPESDVATPLIPNMPAKFPQYAEAYPEVGTPVPAIDKTSGKPYLEKGWTPEMLAFEKERLRIANDMKKNGFTPYFDPELRSDVDPSYYPPNIDTATIVPQKQSTIDSHMAVIGSPEARERLQVAYQRGTEMPNTDNWYAMKQLEDKFIQALGPVAGREAFQNKFATSMAATTGGAVPEGNFLMAMYGNYLRENGLPYPAGAYEMPYPIGGRFAMSNMQQHQKIFDADGFSSLGAGNPKRHDFSQAFTGNPNVVTMDEQMTSGMVPGLTIPKWYGLHEQVAREEAAKAGVSPREFQGVGWSGFKNLKKPMQYTSGEPMIQTVNESIERTHRLTGMSRDEIVRRGIIDGKIPLYGLLGAAGLGAADQY